MEMPTVGLLEFEEPNKPHLYRYYLGLLDFSVNIFGECVDLTCKPVIDYYIILRETPKGYWIEVDHEEKFVLKGPGKRYAHETKEWALESFIRRTNSWKSLIFAQLERINLALPVAYKLLEEEKKNA